MEEHVYVYLDRGRMPTLVGRLWARARKEQESASFEYDKGWLKDRERFSLEPALFLGPGPHHTGVGKAIFGAIGDSAPDRWGRVLMRRAERLHAKGDRRTPRTLMEIDYLLMVDDEARQGALRFAKQEGGPFLREGGASRIPPLLELPRLLAATEHFDQDKETAEDMRLLLAPGSSLGGARPKASVRDKDGRLRIAKFPQNADRMNTVLWEAVALRLAAEAGIQVPIWSLHSVRKKSVLLLDRFDRSVGTRIPFLSAMSMLAANDNEAHSYMEIADTLRRHGAAPAEDLPQLWRRMVFNVLITNTDDHLRNHGFLYAGSEGWRLSPAYDLNPVVGPRVLSLAVDADDRTASLESALSVAEYFELTARNARKVAAEIGRATAKWRKEAKRVAIGKGEIEEMTPAFEHGESRQALALN